MSMSMIKPRNNIIKVGISHIMFIMSKYISGLSKAVISM